MKALDLTSWPEYFTVTFAIIGFLIAFFATPSAFLTYVIFVLFGFIAGRVWWQQRHGFRLSWSLVIIGFVAGYLIGAPHGNFIVMLVLFALGMAAVYYLHDKRHIKSTEY